MLGAKTDIMSSKTLPFATCQDTISMMPPQFNCVALPMTH